MTGVDTSSTMSNPTLYYFDTIGLGEPTRLAFHLGGVPFKDFRFQREQWTEEYKAKAPTGKAPWLEFENGTYLTESKAILLFAASKAGLVPSDFTELAICEQAYSVISESMLALGNVHYGRVEREAGVVTALERLAAADKVVSSRQSKEGWVSGKGMTYVDLAIYAFIKSFSGTMEEVDMSKYESLQKTFRAVDSDPRIQDYYNKRKSE